MGKWMNGYMDKLAHLQKGNIEGGGKDRINVQHQLGKLTARERIEKLADTGSFDEIGSAVTETRGPFDGKERLCPADGIIAGYAKINNRQVMVYSVDFTVMCGSLGEQAVWKLAEITKMAAQMGVPIIGMVDSAGNRIGIKRGDIGLNGLGHFMRYYNQYSGVIPRITMVLGPCIGLMSIVAVLSDFLIINENNGFLWLGGEKKSEEAGNAEFHMIKSGQCHLVAESDENAIDQTKELLSFLPQSCWESPIEVKTGDDPERKEEALFDIMPDDPRHTYDIHEIIDLIVDNGEFFEIQEEYAPHLITGFCRFDGQPVGIVANNPDELSGILEPDSSDKYDRFMMFLDAFNIPLLTLVDTTAFVPGDKWEKMGIIRHGAKLLHGYANLTTRKVTIVLRRSYGGGNIVMGASKMYPDIIYGWPTMEFAPTGPETVVHAIFHKELAKAKEEGKYDEVFNSYLSILKEQFSVFTLGKYGTTYYTVNEIIDPRETRSKIIKALRANINKTEYKPERKRWIRPA